jgi:D-beta-D-heptose 7-phosphate kinase/D-beta-D-heptose 1-phosphate adenosyltransferase
MNVSKFLGKFKGKRILIIGDIMLDKYIWGKVERISPEAPVQVLDMKKETKMLGACGNVGNNILKLGGIPIIVSVIGKDVAGEEILNLLKSLNLKTDGIFVDSSRPTTVKSRIVVEKPHQQLMRIDYEKRTPISLQLEKKLYDYILSFKDKCDAILFEDYDKGVLSGRFISKVIKSFPDTIITADPKIKNFFEYKGITLFKPNKKEVEITMGEELERKEKLKKVVVKLNKKLNCKMVLITLGEEGMILLEENKKVTFIPPNIREVYDTTGAGDTVIAVTTLSLTAGATGLEASILANIAASIEITKFGAKAVELEELRNEIKRVGC